MTDDDAEALRRQIADLSSSVSDARSAIAEARGDHREAIARLQGMIETLAATKTGDHLRLEQAVQDVRHDLKNTKVAVSQVQSDLKKLPRPEELNDALAQVERNTLSVAKLVVGWATASLVGGGVAVNLAQYV